MYVDKGIYYKSCLAKAEIMITLRLDYGGLGPFCSIHANMYFFSHLLIFQWELYIIR